MKRLKAYYAWPKGLDPIEGVDVIFAKNAKEARKIAYKRGEVIGFYSVSYIDIKIRRCPEVDWWAEFAGQLGLAEDFFERDPCFMRDAYGDFDGLVELCGCCGKADTSSFHPDPETRTLLHERWKVCPDCGFCPECGHAVDCEIKNQ